MKPKHLPLPLVADCSVGHNCTASKLADETKTKLKSTFLSKMVPEGNSNNTDISANSSEYNSLFEGKKLVETRLQLYSWSPLHRLQLQMCKMAALVSGIFWIPFSIEGQSVVHFYKQSMILTVNSFMMPSNKMLMEFSPSNICMSLKRFVITHSVIQTTLMEIKKADLILLFFISCT